MGSRERRRGLVLGLAVILLLTLGTIGERDGVRPEHRPRALGPDRAAPARAALVEKNAVHSVSRIRSERPVLPKVYRSASSRPQVGAVEWREQLSSDISDTLTDLVDECYELHGIDQSLEGEMEISLTVSGNAEEGTIVRDAQVLSSTYGDALGECVRESGFVLRAEPPSDALVESWELSILQRKGRRLFIWGQAPRMES